MAVDRLNPIANGYPEIAAIHGIVTPLSVFANNGIISTVLIKACDGGEVSIDLPVYRISPLGVELLLDDATISAYSQKFLVDSVLDLVLTIAGKLSLHKNQVVLSRHSDGLKQLAGFRFQSDVDSKAFDADMADGRGCFFPKSFHPTGYTPAPAVFNRQVYFRLLGMAGRTLKCATSLSNKTIVPGVVLACSTEFPLVAGKADMELRVVAAGVERIDGSDQLVFYAKYADPEGPAASAMGDYLLMFVNGKTVESVKKEGFPVKNASRAFTFKWAKTSDEYLAVLALRKLAYADAGRVAEDARAEDMGDEFDSRARILMVMHRKVLVGSVRLVFHSPEDSTELSAFFSMPHVNHGIEATVEVTRVCTHPEYRRSDLFQMLVKMIVLTGIQAGRPWLLGSATKKLMPIYNRIGIRPTGWYYKRTDLGCEDHEVIYCNLVDLAAGTNLDKGTWKDFYREIYRYLKNSTDAMRDIRSIDEHWA